MRRTKKSENIEWFSVEEKQPKELETILIMCDYVGRSSIGYYDGERYIIAENGMATRKKRYWVYALGVYAVIIFKLKKKQ